MGCQACDGWSTCQELDCDCPCHDYEKAPAMPGDILVYKDGSVRQIVVEARVEVGTESRGCGCCTDEYAKVIVNVFADESTLAISKGGGCVRVLPVESFSELWGWPPKEHQLIRDGKVLWEPPGNGPVQDG